MIHDDVKDLVWKIILLWDNAIEPEEYDKAKDKAAALITARDEWIRRECADIAVKWLEHIAVCDDWPEQLRAIIMGGKE